MKLLIRASLLFLVVWCCACAFGAAGPGNKPNIIFMLADDVGLGNISAYGGHFSTPKIDTLAAGGMRFERCFSTPLCGPSRATALTGRYTFRTRMLTNQSGPAMRRDEVMIPKILKSAGYRTAQVGKWSQVPLTPGDWGFDEYLTFQGSGKFWSSQSKTYSLDGVAKPLGDQYLPDVMHEFLVDFMQRQEGRPFYVHYALSHMHGPILRTPDSRGDEGRFYADNNAYMDKLVGRLIAALEKLGLREQTLIVFTGDNGTARQGVVAATVNGRALSGNKGTMLEGGSRVPLIVSWPGTAPAGRVLPDLIDFTDFLPTFAELAGAKLPVVKIDGHSFAPQIQGQPGQPREWVFVQLGTRSYVRSDLWKLTGTGEFLDMKEAPFNELPAGSVGNSVVRANREKLAAVLADLKAQDTGSDEAPPAKKKKRKGRKI